MGRLTRLGAMIALGLACSSCGGGTLEAAANHLGTRDLKSIRFEGKGANFSVGQAYVAGKEWPRVEIASYTADIDYAKAAMRVDMVRQQPNPEPPGGGIRFAGQQRSIQLVSGGVAWNLPDPASGASGPPQPQLPAVVGERAMAIWTTPHGFVKAAVANAATSTKTKDGSEVSFKFPSGYRVVGTINKKDEVERVQTWIDNPVMGDMLVETTFSDYRDFGGVHFPARIQQTTGGQPSLDLTITAVTANPTVDITVPPAVASFQPPSARVEVQRVAPGVFYLQGGSHHSVAVEMRDHVVLIEAPLSEARAKAVLDAVAQTIPGKPVKYVVNTHVHFDHSGGLRALVNEGATVVTHESNKAFYESAWAAPRALNPDRLVWSKKTPTFMTIGDKGQLGDGSRTIELYTIKDNPHSSGMLMAWLPRERILVEADAYSPPAPGAPAPAPTPTAAALYKNIVDLKLPVGQILGIHGGRVASLADLKAAAGT